MDLQSYFMIGTTFPIKKQGTCQTVTMLFVCRSFGFRLGKRMIYIVCCTSTLKILLQKKANISATSHSSATILPKFLVSALTPSETNVIWAQPTSTS